MNNDILTEEKLFAGIEEKLGQLDGLSGIYGKIMSLVQAEAWNEALDEAKKANIDLFTDPKFSDETARYWRRVTRDVDTLRQRAQEAVTTTQAYATDMSVQMALLRGDEALLKNDVDRLGKELALVDGAVPSWAVGWRNELQMLYDRLRQGATPTQIAANDPYSRLAILRKRGRGVSDPAGSSLTHPPYIEKNLPDLAQHLQQGKIGETQTLLDQIHDELKGDKRLAPFQRMLYADMLTAWRHRADQYRVLRKAVVATREMLKLFRLPQDQEEQLARLAELKRTIDWFKALADLMPVEVLACYLKDQTLAMKWGQTLEELIMKVLGIEKKLHGSNKQWATHEAGHRDYVKRMQSRIQKRAEQGKVVWQFYVPSTSLPARPVTAKTLPDSPATARTLPDSPAKQVLIQASPTEIRNAQPYSVHKIRLEFPEADHNPPAPGQTVLIQLAGQGKLRDPKQSSGDWQHLTLKISQSAVFDYVAPAVCQDSWGKPLRPARISVWLQTSEGQTMAQEITISF